MENKKPTGTVMIPFHHTIHNKISRFLKKHNITTVHIQKRKTAQMQRFAKDELKLTVLGVYQILCKCREVYVRHSRRTIEVRCTEHQRYICLHQPEKSALAEHCSTMGHSINLWGTSILLRTSGFMKCHLKEKTSTHLNKNNIYKGSGFILSQASFPVTCKAGPYRAGTWLYPPTLFVSPPAIMDRYIMTQTDTRVSQLPNNENRDGSSPIMRTEMVPEMLTCHWTTCHGC